MRNVLPTTLKLLLAAVLIYLLMQGGLLDVRQLTGIGDRWPWLLVAQIPLAGLLGLASLRWHLLMRARGVPIHFRDTCAIVLVGWFFNQTMPSSTGGDVAKAWSVAVDHPDRRGDAIVSILVDRITGLVALLTFATVGASINLDLLTSQPQLGRMVVLVLGILVGALAAVLLFYSDGVRHRLPVARIEEWGMRHLRLDPDRLATRIYARVRRLVIEADRALYAYRSHLGVVVTCVALSLMLHSMTVCVNFSLAYALLGEALDPLTLLILVPLAHIGMMFGITPGNVGVGEVVYAELFRWGGIAQGGLICVLQRVCWIAWALLGGAVFLLRRGRTPQAVPEPLSSSPMSSS